MDRIEANLSFEKELAKRQDGYNSNENSKRGTNQTDNDGEEPFRPCEERRRAKRITRLFSCVLGVSPGRAEILEPPGGCNHKCKSASLQERRPGPQFPVKAAKKQNEGDDENGERNQQERAFGQEPQTNRKS